MKKHEKALRVLPPSFKFLVFPVARSSLVGPTDTDTFETFWKEPCAWNATIDGTNAAVAEMLRPLMALFGAGT